MASFNEQIKDFAETPTGRVAIVAVPAVVLALVIAFVALTMLRGGDTQDTPDVETTAVETTAPDTASDGAAQTTDTITSNEATETTDISETTETTTYINENLEIYETRDPFRPFDASETVSGLDILPIDSSETPDPGTGTTELLTLKSIEEDMDGTSYANVTYGSSPYLVTDGDRVGSSPYQVVSVGTDSATFLFGDDQVVLSIGESVDK